MLPNIDGLKQFDDWFKTLSTTEVDDILRPIDPLFDIILAEINATGEF